jgi:hypothetical protein
MEDVGPALKAAVPRVWRHVARRNKALHFNPFGFSNLVKNCDDLQCVRLLLCTSPTGGDAESTMQTGLKKATKLFASAAKDLEVEMQLISFSTLHRFLSSGDRKPETAALMAFDQRQIAKKRERGNTPAVDERAKLKAATWLADPPYPTVWVFSSRPYAVTLSLECH